MAGPATILDLKARSFRPLSEQEETVGGILLGDAWELITSQIPRVEGRSTTDAKFAALVKQVQCAMVLRVIKNPDGLLSEQIDDYQYRRDSAISAGALYLSDDERALLGAGDGESDGAWTIRSRARGRGPGWWEHPDTWVPA